MGRLGRPGCERRTSRATRFDVPQASPQRVRPAATVVALRDVEGARELFVIRRSARSPFMPDTIVFPGGRVDPEDGEGDAGFLRAARREAMEEASLDLGPSNLRWFDTWMTPSGEGPRRYLARFYWTLVDGKTATAAQPDGHEATEGFWISAPTLLERCTKGELDLPPPTLCVARQLARSDWDRLLERPQPELRSAILPKVDATTGGLSILLPHHPRYDEIAGEAGPRPDRLTPNAYPHALTRDQDAGVWRIP